VGESPLEVAAATLASIINYHIWTDRCIWKYNEERREITPIQTANEVWKEMEQSIKARIRQLMARRKWWVIRSEISLAPPETAQTAVEGIDEYAAMLSSILPDWATPPPYKQQATLLRDSRKVIIKLEDFVPLNSPPPILCTNTGIKWRLYSALQPGHSTLDAPSTQAVTRNLQNSSSGSGD